MDVSLGSTLVLGIVLVASALWRTGSASGFRGRPQSPARLPGAVYINATTQHDLLHSTSPLMPSSPFHPFPTSSLTAPFDFQMPTNVLAFLLHSTYYLPSAAQDLVIGAYISHYRLTLGDYSQRPPLDTAFLVPFFVVPPQQSSQNLRTDWLEACLESLHDKFVCFMRVQCPVVYVPQSPISSFIHSHAKDNSQLLFTSMTANDVANAEKAAMDDRGDHVIRDTLVREIFVVFRHMSQYQPYARLEMMGSAVLRCQRAILGFHRPSFVPRVNTFEDVGVTFPLSSIGVRTLLNQQVASISFEVDVSTVASLVSPLDDEDSSIEHHLVTFLQLWTRLRGRGLMDQSLMGDTAPRLMSYEQIRMQAFLDTFAKSSLANKILKLTLQTAVQSHIEGASEEFIWLQTTQRLLAGWRQLRDDQENMLGSSLVVRLFLMQSIVQDHDKADYGFGYDSDKDDEDRRLSLREFVGLEMVLIRHQLSQVYAHLKTPHGDTLPEAIESEPLRQVARSWLHHWSLAMALLGQWHPQAHEHCPLWCMHWTVLMRVAGCRHLVFLPRHLPATWGRVMQRALDRDALFLFLACTRPQRFVHVSAGDRARLASSFAAYLDALEDYFSDGDNRRATGLNVDFRLARLLTRTLSSQSTLPNSHSGTDA